jgi:hypothetical protein
VHERINETLHVGLVGRQEMERDALSALWAYSGQPPELIDQILNRSLVHQCSISPI